MKRVLGRRGFLKLAAAAPALSLARVAAKPKKVLVVGAGLAGLSAAFELTRAGHDVTVLEAQTRPGGRVQTVRGPFADGLYAEAGATNVFDNHHWTRKYLDLFDIELEAYKPSQLASVYLVRGQRLLSKAGQKIEWPYALRADEREMGRRGMWEKYVAPAMKEIGDPEAPGWPPPEALKYDRLSFAEFLRGRGASPEAVAFLRLGTADQLGEGADAVSALDLLRELLQRERRKQSFTIKAGCDRLPLAFSARLGEKIHYGSPVVRVEQGAGGVSVWFTQAGRRQSVSADRVVCAVPFTVLKRIEVSGLSAAKRRAITQLQSTSVARVFLQTRTRFWLAEGLNGNATTDLPVMGVYDKSFNQPGGRGILETYQAGRHARHTASLGERERLTAAVEGASALFPSIKEHFEGGASKCWDEDEWARGAYTCFAPGQMETLMPHVATPEGRIHFAGEHASSLPGWMHGALESGNRAAREVEEAAS
ncbi:MAG TPA: NAD(P)/FAD-dependent oxidoreductase [Pyrinomonadaceae bacterium]|jgi:monoamine oxidase|nr:NAD(P)/FAD-dependent oxidoreductase [Pyrinomonadaceae bacterium]